MMNLVEISPFPDYLVVTRVHMVHMGWWQTSHPSNSIPFFLSIDQELMDSFAGKNKQTFQTCGVHSRVPLREVSKTSLLD